MNLFRTTLAAAAMVLAPLAAHAVTYISNGPVAGGTISLNVPDVYTMDIVGHVADSAGSLSFGFTSGANLVAIETNSLNPNTGFAGAKVEWNSEADGSGTSFGSIDGTDLSFGDELVVSFVTGETKWLIASWTDVIADSSDFDLRVAAVVPVPAAGLLLLTALGGAAALRRRKKAATA